MAKKYFKKEFQSEMFTLAHDNPSDFYLSCWQRNRSSLPLLFIRALVFIGCVGILITSLVISSKTMNIGLWFIFMTHWGVLLITLTSGSALAISLVVFFQGSIDSDFGLPWYAKLYWVSYNVAVTIAFFITAFYWIFLTELAEDYGMDPILDVFIHGINSVLMFVLVITCRHPTRLLHFYLPFIVAVVYMVFTIIFHYAGGLSPFGTSWIYPMLDWDQPGETALMVILCAVAMIVIHAIVVAISVGRDALTKRCRDSSVIIISDERYN